MDSLHFYLFHCFDVGLRTKQKGNVKNIGNTDKKKDSPYFDSAFSRVNKMISERQHITKSFDRFSLKKNNKFSININQYEQNGNDTVSDSLYQHLESQNISKRDIETLQQFVHDEEYDTDCIEDDTDMINSNSNISKMLTSDKVVSAITQFFKAAKISDGSFSIGFRFYYWKYYESIKELPEKVEWNINDHSGYDVCELYVTPKYSSFK
eukprot:474114_1